MEEGIVIRVHGFFHSPYGLPASVTPKIFALDFIRKNLIVDNEHFINFKKSPKIKFPWVVGPFTIKTKDSLPVVEKLPKEMKFQNFRVVILPYHHSLDFRLFHFPLIIDIYGLYLGKMV